MPDDLQIACCVSVFNPAPSATSAYVYPSSLQGDCITVQDSPRGDTESREGWVKSQAELSIRLDTIELRS